MGMDSFPESIAGFKLISVTDNESAHAGLGYTGQYLSKGIKFSIYEYSNGLSYIPDGIDSIVTLNQFNQSVDYVLAINPVAKIVPSKETSSRLIVGRTPLLQMVFTYFDTATAQHERVWSHLYLTASHNKFYKIRSTYSATDYPAPTYQIQKHFLKQFCEIIQYQTDMALAQTIEAPQINDDSFPRDLLPLHFNSLVDGIPINGGWGYSSGDAVIIGENESLELGWQPFDSEALKFMFIEKRIQEELVCSRDEAERCTNIRWNMLAQKRVNLDGNEFDVMTFEVSAIKEKNHDALKAEFAQGVTSATFDENRYWKKHSALRVRYVTDYWYHVKKSMPHLLQSLFDEFTALYKGMVLNRCVVPQILSGVSADGKQFIVQLTGISFSRAELQSFMQTVLAAENAVAYATGCLMEHFGGQGELIEEIYVVTASSKECIQGFATLQRDADGAIAELGVFSKDEDCRPQECIHASLLTTLNVETTSLECDRCLSMWEELKKTAQFRYR
jgi:hypothetical protein